MNLNALQLRSLLQARFFQIIFSCLFTSNLCAQITPTPANSGSSALNFHIIESQTYIFGDQVTILNRVVPPVFLKPSPTPTPTPTPPLTAEQLRAIQAWEAKAHKWIMLEATVYDHQLTDVRWYDAGHQSIRAFSNIDFSYLNGIANIETADTIYEYWIMIIDNETTASLQGDPASIALLANARNRLPKLSASPGVKSAYFVAERTVSTTSANEGIAALNALHAYYDANHNALIANYLKRTEDDSAQQQYLKNHPPGPPPPVTINYWPVKNSRYLTTGTKGSNQ